MNKFDPYRYSVAIKSVIEDDEPLFKATVNELPHVAEYSESYKAAYELAIHAISALHKTAAKLGHQFPEPISEEEEYSGRITLRIPKGLHHSVAQRSKADGVSINLFLTATIAEKVGSRDAYASLTAGQIGQYRMPGEAPLIVYYKTAPLDISIKSFMGESQKIKVAETSTSKEVTFSKVEFNENMLLPFRRP